MLCCAIKPLCAWNNEVRHSTLEVLCSHGDMKINGILSPLSKPSSKIQTWGHALPDHSVMTACSCLLQSVSGKVNDECILLKIREFHSDDN